MFDTPNSVNTRPVIIVAIPCYNCRIQIQRVISSFDSKLLKNIDEIVVIDNQSPDDTPEVALSAISALKEKFKGKINTKFTVLQNDKNYGLGGSHKVAFLYAEKRNATYLAILHGDNQATTSELEELINIAISQPQLDAVLGARFMKKSRLVGYSKFRIFGNKGLNLVYSILTFRSICDIGSGINVFKVEPMKDRRYLHFANGFTFNMDLLLDYVKKGNRHLYHPITWTEQDQESNARMFRVGWIALLTAFRWRLLPDKFNNQNRKSKSIEPTQFSSSVFKTIAQNTIENKEQTQPSPLLTVNMSADYAKN